MEQLTPQRRRLVLAVIALALMMVSAAVSSLNVALPGLARDTGATQTELQWIVDAYTVVFAGLLLSAGALGDRFGRRIVLIAGLIVFGSAAAAAVTIDSPTTLIWLRAIMGVGAALTMPTTLSIITTSFPPQEKGKAIGLWVGIAGGGAVVGIFVSGLLLEWFDWNSIFVLNVVLAVLALIGTIAFIPESRDPQAASLDVVGALLSLFVVGGLVFGIIELPSRGWSDPGVIVGIVGGLAAGVAFVLWELRREHPLLDPRYFRLRGFGTGSLSLTVQFFAFFGFVFVLMQYLQFVAGLSPLQAAVAILPMPIVLLPLARQTPAIADRFGLNRVGSLGLASMAIGMLLISRLEVDLYYPLLAVGLVFLGVGMALSGAPATTAIVSSLPESKQGVASAVNDTTREFGGAIGIAVIGSALNATYRDGIDQAVAELPAQASEQLPPDVVEGAEESIAFALNLADQLGPVGQQLTAVASQSFVDGIGNALVTAAGALVLGAAFVFWRAPRRQQLEVAEDVV